MSNYDSDRSFTDYVHEHLSVPIIYSKLDWKPMNIKTVYFDERDKKDGVDYQAKDSLGLKVTIQERFRDSYYSKFNDFTIRYTRSNSNRYNEKQSEFFKIDATYFIYGITNGKKYIDARDTLTDFIKYIVFDVNELKNLFRYGFLKIPNNIQKNSKIRIENGKKILYTGKLSNPDGSSEFIAIDPTMLKKVLGRDISRVVVIQKGYYHEEVQYSDSGYDLPNVAEPNANYNVNLNKDKF